ncbi:MAG: hypothetical protein AAFR90_06200 [Pseudomonadota bacterium]
MKFFAGLDAGGKLTAVCIVDEVDAWALAEMLRTGWFKAVHVKSVDSHRIAEYPILSAQTRRHQLTAHSYRHSRADASQL